MLVQYSSFFRCGAMSDVAPREVLFSQRDVMDGAGFTVPTFRLAPEASLSGWVFFGVRRPHMLPLAKPAPCNSLLRGCEGNFSVPPPPQNRRCLAGSRLRTLPDPLPWFSFQGGLLLRPRGEDSASEVIQRQTTVGPVAQGKPSKSPSLFRSKGVVDRAWSCVFFCVRRDGPPRRLDSSFSAIIFSPRKGISLLFSDNKPATQPFINPLGKTRCGRRM